MDDFLKPNTTGTTMSVMNRKINEITNRRFILIGDSYGVVSTSIKRWTTLFKEYLRLSDYNCYISSVGGSGFVGVVSTTFNDQLNTIYGSVSNPETITDIIVMGGYNEINQNQANVITAIQAFINNAKSKFPNALVTIGMIGYSTLYDNRVKLMNVIKSYNTAKTKCRVLNNLYAPLTYYTNDKALMSSDTIHPTQEGYLALTPFITNGVIGGINPTILDQISFTITSDTNTITSNIMLNRSSSGMVITIPNTFRITFGNTKPTSALSFNVGTINGVVPNILNKGIPFQGLAHFSDNKFKNISGVFGFLQSSSFFIMLFSIDPNTGGYINYSNCDYITIYSGSYLIPFGCMM